MRNIMEEYVQQRLRGGGVARPLPIMVFGPLGGGKTFAVREVSRFREGGTSHPIGPAIFVFVGATASSRRVRRGYGRACRAGSQEAGLRLSPAPAM